MPNVSRTTGKTPMSRAEAARHASLVRWKKEQPLAPASGGMSNPKIRARVAEILAEKNKKKGPKGKAKGKAKAAPKDKRTPQEKANQNRAQIAKQTGVGDLEGTMVRLNAGMQGAGMENDKHDELIKKGLAERHADGTVTLSAAGKKWKAAADKGDVEKAQGALAEGQAKVADSQAKEKAKADKQQEREKSKTERTAVAKKKAEAEAKRKQAQKRVKKQQTKDKQQADADEETQRGVADALAKWQRVRAIQKAGKAMDMDTYGDGVAPWWLEVVAAAKAADLAPWEYIARTAPSFSIKAGARHSRTDMEHLQSIHDSAVACGANCGPDEAGEDSPDDDAAKAIKSIMDNPQWYAQHECGDVMQAANALATLCLLIQSELAEEDEDTQHVEQLVDAARTIVAFIDSELDELEQAAKDDASETTGSGPMKAITEREDVNPKAGLAEYGDVQFADAKNKKYPIDTEEHIRAAWNYINKEGNADKYEAGEVNQIKAKIVAAWKKVIDKAGPPSAGKAVDTIYGSEIKAIGDDIIRGYAVRFGDAEHPDLERDFYTKSTDFWLDHFGWPKPITYHHGMDPATRSDPVIGHWLKAGVDDVGVWMEGQIDRAHAYYKAMKELAARGYLRLSSDSAPQWVIRERQANGTNHVKRWPLVTSSVTVTPMEPRMLPVEVKALMADLGLDAIDEDAEVDDTDTRERQDAAKADDGRARAILLELELLELETS